MATSVAERFTTRLSDLEVGVTVVEPSGVASAIDHEIRPPAVGIPLNMDDATLPESVETDPTIGITRTARTGVTRAELAIAEYGSVVLEADPFGTEVVSLFPELHVAVVRESDIVASMRDAFDWFGSRLREQRSSAIIATGPSATADMGGLVRGAHGPESVHVILVRENRVGMSDAGSSEPEGSNA